jgi:hypothetical protein
LRLKNAAIFGISMCGTVRIDVNRLAKLTTDRRRTLTPLWRGQRGAAGALADNEGTAAVDPTQAIPRSAREWPPLTEPVIRLPPSRPVATMLRVGAMNLMLHGTEDPRIA